MSNPSRTSAWKFTLNRHMVTIMTAIVYLPFINLYDKNIISLQGRSCAALRAAAGDVVASSGGVGRNNVLDRACAKHSTQVGRRGHIAGGRTRLSVGEAVGGA